MHQPLGVLRLQLHLGSHRVMEAAMRGEAPTIAGAGSALRNYIYVKDVGAAIVHALQTNLEGTHLLAGSEILSIREMIEAICAQFLSGANPVFTDGPEATNQIVEVGSAFPRGVGFRDALRDIYGEWSLG